LFFDSFVVVELRSVVQSDRLEQIRRTPDQLDHSFARRTFASVWKFSDEREAGLPLDERRNAVFVLSSDDRISFPVAKRLSRLNRSGTLGDVPLAGEASAAVVAVVPLPAELRGSPEIRVQLTAFGLVLPYVSIDRLMTDGETARPMKPAGDLFGAPLPLKQLFDDTKILS
jgi:hypothetical protein